ncbi:MAG: hypothetical protein AAF340_13710 [Pseudomonadota bacterium]
MLRFGLILSICLALTACSVPDPETDSPAELGDFRLKSNIAVTKTAQKMGVSRDATEEEWEEVLEAAIEKRFRRYAGETLYTLSYSLDGYLLATKGGRLALSNRSAVLATVHIWETDPLDRLEDRSTQLLVLEGLDGETFVGSGLFRTKDEQMARLGAQFAKAVERWLVANSDLFGRDVSDAEKQAARKDSAAQIAQEIDTTETGPARPIQRPSEG